jgi:type VI secretion system secreted protein VgrG
MIDTSRLQASIATGHPIDVRGFAVEARMSELFRVELRVVSTHHAIALDEVIGREARFSASTETTTFAYEGLCDEMELSRVDERGLAIYTLSIVPKAWLLTQRRNHRIFQYESELDIVRKLLTEWGIEHASRIDPARHKARKFRVQYGESDFDFACRMLEDAGISFYFEEIDGKTTFVLDDEPQSRDLRHPLLVYRDSPGVTDGRFVTHVSVLQRVRPSRVTVGDLDYRRASANQPRLSAARGLAQERRLEQFEYEPGAFLYVADAGGSSPTADDRGTARTDEVTGARKVNDRVLAQRRGAKQVRFESNVVELAPGSLLSVAGHPHRMLDASQSLLVTGSVVSGEHDAAWRVQVEAVPTALPYRPERRTPRPKVQGLESATVVGPAGQEIHTDEYGRVRVHFHWDRESKRDQASSCWLPTSQPWAGAGFGGVNLPRIGQEVLVEFLGGDPDRPVVIGRVYTETQGVPDQLPRYKNVSGIMSESTPRLVMGAADGAGAAAPDSLLGGGTPLSPSRLHELVSQEGPFRAASPTGSVHGWHGSGVKFDDSAGGEIVYLQAERDLNIVARNAWTGIVGNARSTRVGTDDQLRVENVQVVRVDGDQGLVIGAQQQISVANNREERIDGRLDQVVGEGGITVLANGNVSIRAVKAIHLESEEGIRLEVKSSSVSLSTSNLVVQSGDMLLVQPKDGGFGS